MLKTNVTWDREAPKVSGYYLVTWSEPRVVSKMWYSTDYGWTFGKPIGAGNRQVHGKKVENDWAWAYLPDACAR